MVNNKLSEGSNASGTHPSKSPDERQKLKDELSFLTGLLSQHKGKPPQKVLGKGNSKLVKNQFLWTKKVTNATASTIVARQDSLLVPSPSSNQYPSKSRLVWQAPNNVGSRHVSNQNSKFKYKANGPCPSIMPTKHGTANGGSGVHVLARGRNLNQFHQVPRTKGPLVQQRSGQTSEGKVGQLIETSTEPSLHLVDPSLGVQVPARKGVKSIGKPCSSPPGSSRIVIPVSPSTKVPHSSGVSTVTSSSATSKRSLPAGQTDRRVMRSPTLISSHKDGKQGPEVPGKPSSKTLTLLAKELDKCLGDIAKIKEAKRQPKNFKDKQMPTTKEHGTQLSSTQLEPNKEIMHFSKVPVMPQTALTKKCKFTDVDCTASERGTSRASSASVRSNYRWVAPKSEGVISGSSVHLKNTTQFEQGGRSGNCAAKDEALPSPINQKSCKMRVFRTKYKMTKQVSLPTASPGHLTNSCKGKHRQLCDGGSKKKLGHHRVIPGCNRYKFVRPRSSPSTESLSSSSWSSACPVRKGSCLPNSGYRKVQGHSARLVKYGKHRAVIPHRSQLRLVNTAGQSPHRKAAFGRSTETQPSTRRTHKLIHHRKVAPVIRSRFKMRKVEHHSPPKRMKQADGSSPFRWQAKRFAASWPGPQDSFMQRRMRYVLTHTPILLRTRFQLIRSHPSAGLRLPHLRLRSPGALYLTPTSSLRVAKGRQLQPLLKKTRTKIIRKLAGATDHSAAHHKSAKSCVLNVKGVRYQQSRSGKSIRRIPSQGTLQTSPTTSQVAMPRKQHGSLSRVWTASTHKFLRHGVPKVSSTQWVANRVLRRTIQSKINRVNRSTKSQAYCKFYNRYGRCHRGDKCPYIHDPERVAVCTQFLRGTCKKTDGTCPFSHKVSKDKMPVCVYFLKGVCNRDDCPYSHVKVSKRAEICQDFLQGYCPRGEKCKKKHTLECAEYNETGQCKLGSRCRLWHRKNRRRSGESRRGTKRGVSGGDTAVRKRLPTSKRANDRPAIVAAGGTEVDKSPRAGGSGRDESGTAPTVAAGADSTEAGTDRHGDLPSFIALDDDSAFLSSPVDANAGQRGGSGGLQALKIRPLFAPSTTPGASPARPVVSSSSATTVTTGCELEPEDSHLSPGPQPFGFSHEDL